MKTPPNHFRYNNEQIITCQKTKPKHQKRRGGGCDQSRRTTGRVNRPIPKSNIFHLLQNNRRLFHRRRSRPGNLPVRIRKIHLLRRQKRKILDLQNRYQQSLRLSQAFRPKANPLRRPIFHKSGGPGPDPRRSLPGRRSKEELYQTCKSLKPPYDEIALDYYYHELDAAEIAEKRGRNVKTVQTQIYRARGMLRKHYDKKEGKRA